MSSNSNIISAIHRAIKYLFFPSLRSDIFILEIREGVGEGGGGGSEEMSSCSHVLLTPVQQLILRSSQSSEHYIKCQMKMRLRIPADKQHELGKYLGSSKEIMQINVYLEYNYRMTYVAMHTTDIETLKKKIGSTTVYTDEVLKKQLSKGKRVWDNE